MPYYFRLPVITDLTTEQQAALYETGAIAVSGGPGTGKSVVSLWRHIQNHSMRRRKSLLLTYTKSLEYYLAASSRSENEDAGKNVNRTYWWTCHHKGQNYDEIIIDEAQDVEEEKYKEIKTLTKMVSYSADDNQIVFPDKSTKEKRLHELFKNNKLLPRLQENYRNTKQIVQFVKSMFTTTLITAGEGSGPKPSVILSLRSYEMETDIIKDIINNFKSETHNIAILVPYKKQVEMWYSKLMKAGIKCSKFTGDDGEIGTIDNIHITTYKSSKGLEFDTVIIPDFDEYEKNLKKFKEVVDTNDYYVVFTRARRNLFLIDNSGKSNTICKLDFLKLQIDRNIVEVDDTYTKGRMPTNIYQEQEIPPPTIAPPEIDFHNNNDDLPF
jgi:superfamily I DNA/RNA helicase